MTKKLSYYPPAPPMLEAFIEFHRSNLHVYDELRRLAMQLKRRGYSQYGIKSLFEVVRWHRALNTSADDDFKLNNNYGAFYSRILMHFEPQLKGFFRQRASIADDYPLCEMVGRGFLWSISDETDNN